VDCESAADIMEAFLDAGLDTFDMVSEWCW